MHSEILRIGPLVIRAYGLMLFLSFLVGLAYVRSKASAKRINADFAVNLAFLVIFTGVIGARLFYVFYHWSEFAHSPLDIINPFGSSGTIGIAGLNLYGGLITAIISGVLYLRLKKQLFWETFDLFAPTLGLGIFLTRIGCFLNGCCFGKECSLPWAVHFPKGSIPYDVFGSAGLHPTQLYSSLYGLVIFLTLLIIDRRRHFPGLLFAVLLIMEAFFRFLIEFVRYYESAMLVRVFGLELTLNHLVAVGLFVLGWVMLIGLRAHARRAQVQR